MPRRWKTDTDLYESIRARAEAGKQVVLSPDTALFIALRLRDAAKEKPTRNQIARLLCVGKCEELCIGCIGSANKIARAYGASVDY